MKKKVLLIVLLAFLVTGAALTVTTVPVYPAFQKDVETFGNLKEKLGETVLYPKLDEDVGVQTRYALSLDGRTLLAKPKGYVIEQANISETDEVWLFYLGRSGENEAQGSHETVEYRGVTIGLTYGNALDDPLRACSVGLEFSCSGMTYELVGQYTRHVKTDAAKIQLAEENQAMIEKMQDELFRQCQEMIDEAFKK